MAQESRFQYFGAMADQAAEATGTHAPMKRRTGKTVVVLVTNETNIALIARSQ